MLQQDMLAHSMYIWQIIQVPYDHMNLEHPEDLHPALVGILLLVAATFAALGKPGEGVVENLGEMSSYFYGCFEFTFNT